MCNSYLCDKKVSHSSVPARHSEQERMHLIIFYHLPEWAARFINHGHIFTCPREVRKLSLLSPEAVSAHRFTMNFLSSTERMSFR